MKEFAAEFISDEIHKQTSAFADKTRVVIGKDEFTNEMSHLCRSERFKNFNSKDDIPIKQLVNYVCSYLSDVEDGITVSCNYFSDNFEIRLKY